jgi:hypothetical protein
VSEYQYYDFRALDRPLTRNEMAALRSISTRASITATSFTNHYEWGDLKANPGKLLEKYFDAFVYVANWGTHEFYIRLPQGSVDYKSLKAMVPNTVPTENSVQPIADLIPSNRTANLEQFADLLESGEPNSPITLVQGSTVRTRISKRQG